MDLIKRERVSYIDVAKAVAMISVVMFHACTNHENTYMATNAYFIRFTSAYALPVFFFINGFLYRNKNIMHPIKEIIGKIKRYYIPFLCYNLFYLLAHNLFVFFHMVDNQYGNGYYSLKEYLIHFFKAITGHREFFSGALWFLGSILIMNVIMIVCEYCIHIFFHDRGMLVLLGIVTIVCMMAGNSGCVTDRMKIATSLANLGYFYFGMLYKKLDLNNVFLKRKTLFIVLGIVLNLLLSYNKLRNPLGISNGYIFIVLDYINAMFGIIAVMMICQIPCVTNCKILQIVGANTVDIMALHFMVFKVVSLLIIWVYDLPVTRLAEYPVLRGIGGAWWLLYAFVGVFVPTLFSVWRHKAFRKENKT